jgi:succinate-semialdehyde dehydrogenase / glutarate-semialdehyde dehydrogenase
MAPAPPSLRDAALFKPQAYINGHWVTSKSGRTFDVVNPSTSQVLAQVPELGEEEVIEAIEAAANALVSFRKTTRRERARLLRKWYELVMENKEDLATLITLENGKIIAESRAEVEYAANYFEWFSEEAGHVYGETISPLSPDNRVYTIKEPIGVCALITPWNWPAGMVTRKIGPAIAAGCTVVIKSPGETPLTSSALAELGQRAGIPPGVINIVTTLHNTPQAGNVLTTHPKVKKLSFTGSTRVGKILMKQASSTLKKLSFELGGNAPFIVFDDADLDLAVAGAIACKFRSTGQTCVCANRIYVQKGIYEEFVQAVVDRVNAFKVGDGFGEGNTHGPLIHQRAVDKVQEHIEDAVKHGAKVIVGGSKIPELGEFYFQPTVIRDMTADMLLAHDETFGPIAGLFQFDTEAEVVERANDSDVGLGGFFYSQNVQRCYRVAEALQVGMIGVNSGIISDVAQPFGGVKESGFGREGSRYGIDEYLVVKSVTVGGIGRPL